MGGVARGERGAAHRPRRTAVFLELLVAAVDPVRRNRREPAPVIAPFETEPSSLLPTEPRRAADGDTTVAVAAVVRIVRSLLRSATVVVPALLLAGHDVKRVPLLPRG